MIMANILFIDNFDSFTYTWWISFAHSVTW
ncbi:hypothetical protein VCSRO11_0253 [Vibrio cholerae]|nr:hypothetical protein VCSRO11_0253 [Vibrio cholerae]